MNGVLVAVAGVWALCQVFGGNALVRLGVLDPEKDANWNVDPGTGVPNQDPKKPLLRDPQGRVY